jgi:predicted PurR-regulated permease PerM
VATKFISFMFKTVLLLMITAFLLIDYNRINNFMYSMVPLKDRNRFRLFLDRLDQRLSGVVRGQLTICIINAILTLFGLLILKVKFAFILATLAGIFSLVPIFGSIASTIPIVLVALTTSLFSGLLALIWIIAIHTLEANLLNPKIMGHSAKIHPVLILLALLAGEHYHGIIGALLAVPIMSILITIFSSILSKAHQMDEGLAKPANDDRITL